MFLLPKLTLKMDFYSGAFEVYIAISNIEISLHFLIKNHKQYHSYGSLVADNFYSYFR